jgi:hypothetical protein
MKCYIAGSSDLDMVVMLKGGRGDNTEIYPKERVYDCMA